MDWLFLVRFIFLLAVIFAAGQLPTEFLQNFKLLTAAAVAFFWKILHVPITHSGPNVTFYDFPMLITMECTAFHYMGIYSSGVLALRARSLSSRLGGIFFGLTAIFAVNVLRIGIVGLIGHAAREAFDFVHAYLWQGTFLLIVFVIWVAWANGWTALGAITKKALYRSFAVSAASYALIMQFMDGYARFLAVAADTMFAQLAFATGMKISAIAEGVHVGYVTQQGIIYNKIEFDVLNTVVFCALAAGFSPRVPRVILLKRIVFGGVLLFLQHLGYVVLYGAILSSGTEGGALAALLWMFVGLSLAAPIVVWLVVSVSFPASREGSAENRDAKQEESCTIALNGFKP